MSNSDSKALKMSRNLYSHAISHSSRLSHSLLLSKPVANSAGMNIACQATGTINHGQASWIKCQSCSLNMRISVVNLSQPYFDISTNNGSFRYIQSETPVQTKGHDLLSQDSEYLISDQILVRTRRSTIRGNKTTL
jgi:hypothetical protein